VSRERPNAALDHAVRLFLALTAVTPRRYREHHRDEAVDLLARLAAEAYRDRGVVGVFSVTASAILDLAAFLPAVHVRRSIVALRRDVPHAVRSLLRRPVSSAAAMTTLAIGIGLNAAVFSVVDWVLLRPLPYPSPHELVKVSATGTTPVAAAVDVSYAEFLRLSRAATLPDCPGDSERGGIHCVAARCHACCP
jgi:hypothetical protein